MISKLISLYTPNSVNLFTLPALIWPALVLRKEELDENYFKLLWNCFLIHIGENLHAVTILVPSSLADIMQVGDVTNPKVAGGLQRS